MDNEDRYTKAFVLRLDASSARKRALFLTLLGIGALFAHILWLALVILLIVIVYVVVSIALVSKANALWPNPEDYEEE